MRKILFSLLLSAACLQPAFAFSPGRYVDDMWIDEGEHLIAIEPKAGQALELSGWTRSGRGDVYRVKVKAGDHLRLEVSSQSDYLLLAVFDFATPDEEAIYFSEPGNRKTILTIKRDTELLVRPIYILGQPRRGLGVKYQLVLERMVSKDAKEADQPKAQGSEQ